MTDQELLSKATSFLIWGHDSGHDWDITVENRGKDRWAICLGRSCWNKTEKDFVYESLPSSRTEEFMKNSRFSLQEAVGLAQNISEVYEKARQKTMTNKNQFGRVLNNLLDSCD